MIVNWRPQAWLLKNSLREIMLRLCKRTRVLLERDYNSSWMLRVLGKLMGSNNLR
jgi:hypothetical protein